MTNYPHQKIRARLIKWETLSKKKRSLIRHDVAKYIFYHMKYDHHKNDYIMPYHLNTFRPNIPVLMRHHDQEHWDDPSYRPMGHFPKTVYILGARDGWFCRYCKVSLYPDALHIKEGSQLATKDHIIPRSEGGSSDLDNLCLSCGPCNHKKQSKSVEEFLNQNDT
jgi:5-methylcytosine-specific restriction endonuclease McrA